MTIVNDIWADILKESENKISLEPESQSLFQEKILSCNSLNDSLSGKLADDLSTKEYSSKILRGKFNEVFSKNEFLEKAVIDLKAVKERDPASSGFVFTLLFSKGFAALQSHRIANYFMKAKQEVFAYFVQSRSSAIYEVDIHPNAEIGHGVMLDHATGIVIGETSVIENDVSIFQGVTLGGTGKETGDRHPKVGKNVTISANVSILGNIKIGDNVKIGASSLVLEDLPANCTAVGVPAKIKKQ